MTVVDVQEAEMKLAELVARVQDGEDVVIARAGVALVRLVPVDQIAPRRNFGWLVGVVEPPPDEVLIGEDPDVLALFDDDKPWPE